MLLQNVCLTQYIVLLPSLSYLFNFGKPLFFNFINDLRVWVIEGWMTYEPPLLRSELVRIWRKLCPEVMVKRDYIESTENDWLIEQKNKLNST